MTEVVGSSVSAVEEWRQVVGYEGYYEVSSLGRVRSQPRPGTRGGLLRTRTGPNDRYHTVGMRQPGSPMRRAGVHVLVAAAFFGPRPAGMQVCHNDGDRDKNTSANLRYDTPSANAMDRKEHGTDPYAKRTHCPQGHAYDEVNTRVVTKPDGRKGRQCKACTRTGNRIRMAAARSRQKDA